MKVALVTTTINVPHVLKLYRKLGPDVKFFIALDKNAAFKQIAAADNGAGFMNGDRRCSWFTPTWQEQYSCSELIGWNCIQRRNIATLEALKWGADIIVSVDDDNLALTPTYFEIFERVLAGYSGLKASSLSDWFDVGTLLDPVSPHRGFPRSKKSEPVFNSICDAKIGVAAGIVLGDPDIDACTRMVNGPIVHRVSELLRSGIVVDLHCKTVFNSQNTAFIRQLAPAFFMFPGLGRYDDICASLVMQRIMREKGLHVHFGQPFVIQQRNAHDLIKDLKAEIWGMAHVERFASFLDRLEFNGRGNVLEMCQHVAVNLADESGWFPVQAGRAFAAYLDDCEKSL